MTHLTEAQFIDVLLGEIHATELDQHLAACKACQAQMEVLKRGFTLTKVAEPELPNMHYPNINYRGFKRKAVWTRLAWIAAAAMFLLSILGFRMEVNDGSMAFEFSLFGKERSGQHQIADLEKKLLDAIDMNATIAQKQIDARFNAIYQEQEVELGQFREAVVSEVKGLEILGERQLLTMRNELNGNIEKLRLEGKLK